MSDINTARSPSPSRMPRWCCMLADVFKENNVGLVSYVPDSVLSPLIDAMHGDAAFKAFAATREEEAVGIACGAWMGGLPSVVMMQTSGFATLSNVLASLVMPYGIPLVMIVSERGTLGEFNVGQAMVCRTMRPTLDTLGIEHHTLARIEELEFVADRSIRQAVATKMPVALILSPLLTGGKALQKAESS